MESVLIIFGILIIILCVIALWQGSRIDCLQKRLKNEIERRQDDMQSTRGYFWQLDGLVKRLMYYLNVEEIEGQRIIRKKRKQP